MFGGDFLFGIPDGVVGRQQPQRTVGKQFAHQRSKRTIKAIAAATGFGKDEAALTDVLLEVFLLIGVERKLVAAAHEQDGRFEQVVDRRGAAIDRLPG